MGLPKIEFTPWIPWKQRNEKVNPKAPGVYVLAKFAAAPTGNANPLDKDVIYFGETCRSLKGRWRQFEISAFQGKRAHSGGSNYREAFKNSGENLYVAALPVTEERLPNKKLRNSFIRYVERKLLLDWVAKFKKMPKCNKK